MEATLQDPVVCHAMLHNVVSSANFCAGGMLEIFLFILVAGLTAHVIGASVHEGIFVGALVRACFCR